MPYMHPGVAIASALEDYMVKQAMEERKAKLDAQADQKFQFEMEKARRAQEIAEEDRKLKLEDRERTLHEKRMAGKVPGDFISPTEIVSGHEVGEPVRLTTEAPMPEQVKAPGIITELSESGQAGETPVAPLPAGNIRFGGSPEQAKELQLKQRRQEFIERVAKMSPEERTRLAPALENEGRDMGLNTTAASYEPPAPKDGAPAIGSFEDYVVSKYGPRPTPAQITQARKDYMQADDRPPTVVSFGDGALSPKQMSVAIQLANSLKSHPQYTKMVDVKTGLDGVRVGLQQKNDVLLVNSFQRIADPGATVREGDIGLMRSTVALKDLVLSEYPIERLMEGALLPDSLRKKLAAAAEAAYQARASYFNDSVGNQYKNLAKGANIPYNMIGDDFDLGGAAGSALGQGQSMPVVGGDFMGGKVLAIRDKK